MTRLEIDLREALEELIESASFFRKPKPVALNADIRHALKVVVRARREHGMSGRGHGIGSTNGVEMPLREQVESLTPEQDGPGDY